MSGTPSGLFDACSELLDIAVATLGGLAPGRQYVSVNPPALDCPPQITVHPDGTGESADQLADVGLLHRLSGPTIIETVLVITVAWCMSVPKDPNQILPVDVLESEAQVVALGGWALWNGLRSAARAQQSPFNLCHGARIQAMVPLLASGAAAGWVLPVTVVLDGYSI